MQSFPLTLPALRVQQPLGDFFVVSLPADTLRQVTFLDPTRISRVNKVSFYYWLSGAQRQHSKRRAKDIAKYIDSSEAAFPNSIILAANYIDDGVLQEDETKIWAVNETSDGCFQLHIPSSAQMASVIDGQHRLLGFDYCEPARKTMELLCAVYMDLPHAYQAYLFATININQRKVDKSLAYEQFGYNLDTESREGWAPDKVAVYLTRRVNLDPKSPLYGRIKVAPLNSELLFPEGLDPSESRVSTACLVEGISRLISQNPKSDRDALHKLLVGVRKRSILGHDESPLRSLYLESRDDEVYNIIETFLGVARDAFWTTATEKSFIRKTLGIQALLDVLKAALAFNVKSTSAESFLTLLSPASKIDFSDSAFQGSGRGRVRIRNLILLYAGRITAAALPEADKDTYTTLMRKYPKCEARNG